MATLHNLSNNRIKHVCDESQRSPVIHSDKWRIHERTGLISVTNGVPITFCPYCGEKLPKVD